MSDSAEEEVFEVEEIQAHKFVKRNKEVLYFIKWLNYPPEDNTWEKEANVFAIDLIEKYWSAMPPTSKDRRQFEKINNSRKKPIKLTSPVTIPTVTPVEATSSPESSTTTADKNGKQQQTLDSVFGVYKGKGKENEVITLQPAADKPVASATASPSPAAAAARLPQVIATNNNEDDDVDEDEEDEEEERMEIDDTDDEDAYATPTRSSDTANSASDNEPSTQEEEPAKTTGSKRTTGNDSSRQQEDYFLKQHEKKRKREELGISDDSSIESLSPPLKSKKAVVNIEEIQEDEDVIFNEKYAIDPPLDWATQTERVEYIGREVDQSDLYCLVRWKDGVKSMHPLNLVREKRPDLVIDRFVQMVMQQQ